MMSQRKHRVVVQIIDVLDTYRKKSRARSLLLLRFKSDAEHLTTPLAPVEVSIMLPVEQNSFTIDLLKAPRGHQPAQGILDSASAVTTWRISIDELKLVGRHEVLLRGQGGSWPANVAVHVALTTVPIGSGEVPPRRPGDAPMMLDRQGFPIQNQLAPLYKSHMAQYQPLCESRLRRWEAVELEQFQATPNAEAAAAEGAAPLSFDEAQLEQAALIGFPEMLRGQLWQVACGASEARAANPGVYSELLHSAAMQGSKWANDIEQDIERTFPEHAMLCESSGRQALGHVLLALSVHLPLVGYCQSMNFLAGFLLLRMEEEAAFWTLEAIVSRRFEGFYSHDMFQCQIAQLLLQDLIEAQLPKLAVHLEELQVRTTTFAMRWFLCLFVGVLPTECTLRVWDLLMLHGRPVLFRVTLTLLSWFETSLCNCPTFEDIFEALKQTPPCEFDADALVKDAMGNKYFSEQQFNQLWTDKFDTYVAQLDRRVVVGRNQPRTKAPPKTPDEAAVKIQAIARGNMSRQQSMQRERAAIMLQTTARKMSSRHKLSKMLNAKWQYHVQDVLSCWRDLHVSLTRRSDFWSKYCRAPKLETLPVLRTEGRKLHARRHKMRKSHPGVPLHSCADILASQANLDREKEFLLSKLRSSVSEQDQQQLFKSWQLNPSQPDQAQEQMLGLIWAPSSTVWRSAALVQWLVAGQDSAKAQALQLPEPACGFKKGRDVSQIANLTRSQRC